MTSERDPVRPFLRAPGALGIALGLGLLALSLIKEPLHPALIHRPAAAACSILLGLAVACLPVAAPMRRKIGEVILASRPGTFHGSLFALGTIAAASISLVVFDGLTRLDDGVAAIFQARIFASGHIVLPLPPLARFYECFGVLGHHAGLGHWCGMYPPGWPALLVPGVLLGATWLVNPVLHGLLCVATARLGDEIYGPRTGRMAGVLCLTSPLLAVLGGEQLSHTATALFLCLCALATCRLLRTGLVRHGCLAGFGWGLAFLCRPLTSLVVGAAIGLRAAVGWRRAMPAWRGLLAAALIAAGSAGLLAAFQKATTGDSGKPGHTIGLGPRGKLGFGRLDRARNHTPALGVEWTLRRLRNINHHMLGWPVPFYLMALLPFLRGRARGNEYWLLAPSTWLLAVFSAFWYYELYYPSRYISEGTPMLLVLAARALAGDPADAARRWAKWSAPLLGTGLSFLAIAGGPEFRARFHANYGDIESVLPRVVETYGITNAVVFMDSIGEGTDAYDPRNKYYATGFLRNDLALTGSVVYANNMQEKNIRLMRHFEGRAFYLYRFDRTTRRARLYVLTPDGDRYTLSPVEPRESDLLEHAP
jgi:hypothetical protein